LGWSRALRLRRQRDAQSYTRCVHPQQSAHDQSLLLTPLSCYRSCVNVGLESSVAPEHYVCRQCAHSVGQPYAFEPAPGVPAVSCLATWLFLMAPALYRVRTIIQQLLQKSHATLQVDALRVLSVRSIGGPALRIRAGARRTGGDDKGIASYFFEPLCHVVHCGTSAARAWRRQPNSYEYIQRCTSLYSFAFYSGTRIVFYADVCGASLATARRQSYATCCTAVSLAALTTQRHSA
jgi:hypothetical protein